MTVSRETWVKMIRDAYNDYRMSVMSKHKEYVITRNDFKQPPVMISYSFMRIMDVGKGRVTILNLNTGKMGTAKCNSKFDGFDAKTGIAIAWMRYCGKEIPEIKATIRELPLGTVVRLADSSEKWMILCKHPLNGKYVLQKVETVGDNYCVIEVDGTREIEEIWRRA